MLRSTQSTRACANGRAIYLFRLLVRSVICIFFFRPLYCKRDIKNKEKKEGKTTRKNRNRASRTLFIIIITTCTVRRRKSPWTWNLEGPVEKNARTEKTELKE